MEAALQRSEAEDDEAAYAFSYILAVNCTVNSLKVEKVCPFCTFFELGDKACRNVGTRQVGKKNWTLIDRLTYGEMGAQWVNAAAQAHNKEMHALNGNIDSVALGAASREGRLGMLRDLFWDQACEMTHEDGPSKGTTYEALLANPVTYYARGPDRSSRALTNAGTLHQYFCPGVRAMDGGFMEDEQVRVMTEDGDFVPEEREGGIREAGFGDVNRGPAGAETIQPGNEQLMDQRGEQGLDDAPTCEGVAVVADPPLLANGERDPYPMDLIGGEESWQRLKWVGVGIDPRLRHGKLQRTETAALVLEAATNPSPSCPGVINPARGLYTYGYMSNTPSLAAGLDSYISNSKADYRSLAIKVDLYDELREKRVVQPSGVGYAWATADEPESHIISTRATGDWNYEAVFITADVLEAMLRAGGDLLVGGRGGEVWNVRQDAVRVIPVADNGQPDCVGRDVWIVSQLTYPLAQVFDVYDMAMVGDVDEDGGQRTRRETFIRTAGLVDIADRESKLIFVVPTRTSSSIALGGVVYDVQSCDHRGELPRDRVMVAHDIVSLTVRWHQKIEGMCLGDGGESAYFGAPRGVLETMGLMPSDEVADDSYRAYGGWSAVLGMDQRVARRQCARRYPVVRVGAWDSLASLALGTGYAYYDAHSTENDIQIAARCKSGGLDRLSRGRLLRRGFELFKRSSAQQDRIAFPAEDQHTEKYWSRLIKDPIHGTGTTTSWFAGYFITDHANYSWAINQHAQGNGGTFTGIRTPSSYWRSTTNTEWGGFLIQSSGRPGGEAYAFDTSRQSWTSMCYAQFGQGEDDGQLEEALMRLDMNQFVERNWGLSYKTHPHGTQMDGVVWAVDESYGGSLARVLGWEDTESSAPPLDAWGWGVAIRVKDYTSETIKTLVIPRGTASIATGSQYADGTILFRGDIDENDIDASKLTARGAKLGRTGNGEGAAHVPGVSPKEERILNLQIQPEEATLAWTAEEKTTRGIDTERGSGPQTLEEKENKRGAHIREAVQRVAARPEVIEEHGGKEVRDVPVVARH